jgi:hypothetical protein
MAAFERLGLGPIVKVGIGEIRGELESTHDRTFEVDGSLVSSQEEILGIRICIFF